MATDLTAPPTAAGVALALARLARGLADEPDDEWYAARAVAGVFDARTVCVTFDVPGVDGRFGFIARVDDDDPREDEESLAVCLWYAEVTAPRDWTIHGEQWGVRWAPYLPTTLSRWAGAVPGGRQPG